jgi:hypothetical protein
MPWDRSILGGLLINWSVWMRSYAIWAVNKDPTSSTIKQPNMDIHINLWKLPTKAKSQFFTEEKYEYFLDFGLMIDGISSLGAINVFFPFILSNTDVTDLGKNFAQNTNLVTSVFNEDYQITVGPQIPKQIMVGEAGSTAFVIYMLDVINEDCQFENRFDGTVMSIKVPDSLKSEKVYYRFRICSSGIGKMVRVHKAIGSLLETAHSRTEVIDFRINEKRLYDRSMNERVSREVEFKVNKIHFLFMTDSEDDIVTMGENPTCRQLEKDLWEMYVDERYNLNNVFAYHWRVKADSYNSLIKVRIKKSSFRVLLRYIVILTVLAIANNILTGPVQTVLDHLVKLFAH